MKKGYTKRRCERCDTDTTQKILDPGRQWSCVNCMNTNYKRTWRDPVTGHSVNATWSLRDS